jgi:hypothetical protein
MKRFNNGLRTAYFNVQYRERNDQPFNLPNILDNASSGRV